MSVNTLPSPSSEECAKDDGAEDGIFRGRSANARETAAAGYLRVLAARNGTRCFVTHRIDWLVDVTSECASVALGRRAPIPAFEGEWRASLVTTVDVTFAEAFFCLDIEARRCRMAKEAAHGAVAISARRKA